MQLQADHPKARALLKDSLEIAKSLGLKIAIAYCLEALEEMSS